MKTTKIRKNKLCFFETNTEALNTLKHSFLATLFSEILTERWLSAKKINSTGISIRLVPSVGKITKEKIPTALIACLHFL